MLAQAVRQLWHDLPPPGAALVAVAAPTRHRLERVLRLNLGARMWLADGQGRRLQAIWRGAAFESDGELQTIKPDAIHVTLGAGLLKGERWDWLIEKSVELGVNRLIPLQLDHCVVRVDAQRGKDKVARWRAIAVEAFEQCGRSFLPEIAEPATLETWLAAQHDCLLCFCDERSDALSLDGLLRRKLPQRLAILIGPEGGLSTPERARLAGVEAVGVSLGPDVLRAETAALAALVIARAALDRASEASSPYPAHFTSDS